MAFSLLRFLGLRKERKPLTEEQIAEQRRNQHQAEADPLGGDNPDGFGDDGAEGDGDGE